MQPGPGYRFTSSSMGISLDIGDPWPARDTGTKLCPLEIYNLRKSGDNFYINIAPGMVNNLVVKSDDGVLLTNDPPPDIQVFSGGLTETETNNYIYIKSGNTAAAGSTPAQYPSKSGLGYPSIRVYDTNDKTDDDDYSYILIGIVSGKKVAIPGSDPVAYNNVFSIEKMIGCNSLWTERFKCGTNTAIYWWSAV
jgi:hypothetical protein